MNERFRDLIKQEWPQLEAEERIGAGAYGEVYKCRKVDPEVDYVSYEAVKIIMIPRSRDEYPEGEIVESEEEYYTQLKDKAVEEIKSLEQLKSPHIVHINDRRVVRQDEIGYYILIRMDLLKGLDKVCSEFRGKSAEEAEPFAIRLLRDMCNAMGVCFQNSIVHRDIKPENIFISENGDFYLGDFGLAKQISGLSRNLSSRGTEQYAAPEIGTDGCSFRSDIYSLGMVLYRIVNFNRPPFIPEGAKARDLDEAQNRRVNGEKIPAPENCSPEFGRIILKMLEYDPQKRYSNILEVEKDLKDFELGKRQGPTPVQNVVNKQENIHVDYNQTNTVVQNETTINNTTVIGNIGNMSRKKGFDIDELIEKLKKNKYVTIGIGAVLLIILIALIRSCSGRPETSKEAENQVVEQNNDVEEKPTTTPDPTQIAENSVTPTPTPAVETPTPEPEQPKDFEWLSDMKIVEEHGGFLCKDCMNTLGDTFHNVPVVFSTSTDDQYSVYHLGKEYEKLYFDVSCYEHEQLTSGVFGFYVYADDNATPIYSLDMSRTTPQTHVELDVTGVEFIKFSVEKIKVNMSKGVILANALVSKNGYDPSELITTETPTEEKTETKLSDMKIVDETGAFLSENCSNSLGTEFKNVPVIRDKTYKDAYASYYLGKEYAKLVFDVSCLESDMITNGEFDFSVYVDDNSDPIYTMVMSRSTAQTNVELDVTGVDFIKFAVENNPTGNMHKGIILSSGVLYKEGAEVQASDNPDTAVKSGPTKLSDMKIVATEGGFVSKACEDSLGNTYKNVPVIYKWTYDNIYSKYYLAKGYSKLSFDVSCYENEEIHANYNFIFRVYGDDPKTPIYSLNVNRSLPLTHVDLDVSGVEFLTFSVENDPSGNTTKGVVLSSAMLE